MHRDILAVPMGDPAGIGPEIIVKALTHESVRHIPVIVVADARVMRQAVDVCDVPLTVRPVDTLSDARFEPGVLNVLDTRNVDMAALSFGNVSAMCGRAAYECIEKAVGLAMSGSCAAVVTPPINKESLKAACVPFIGHTEIFGSLTGSHDPLTMFEVHGMRVFFLTRHVSLRDACDLVKKERIQDYIVRCTKALSQLGIAEGTMAVAGLNPHCGEHGLFGREEVDEVVPAIEAMQKAGYHVVGPIGADSVFHQAKQGRFAAVLSLYHDQGHVACKTLDFDRTISLTLGMPILRTSVDHGTAFDIAGQGVANETGMVEAILAGARYAPKFATL